MGGTIMELTQSSYLDKPEIPIFGITIHDIYPPLEITYKKDVSVPFATKGDKLIIIRETQKGFIVKNDKTGERFLCNKDNLDKKLLF